MTHSLAPNKDREFAALISLFIQPVLIIPVFVENALHSRFLGRFRCCFEEGVYAPISCEFGPGAVFLNLSVPRLLLKACMITIVSGTNRISGHTAAVAAFYHDLLSKQMNGSRLLDLAGLPADFLLSDVYDHSRKPLAVQKVQDEFFVPASKFVFMVPEYNGSLPGALKLLIDGLDPRIAFRDKKAALIGISTGRAGNLRGLDHLASILQHMQVTVMPYLLPVSGVHKILADRELMKDTEKLFLQHIGRFLSF